MSEPEYRKIQCEAGHWSEPINVNEALPRQCHICGMPYDRRYNKPVLCGADGSIINEENITADGKKNTSDTNPENKSDFTVSNDSEKRQEFVRRRRIISDISQQNIEVRNEEAINNSSDAKIILRSGQYTIPIDERGIYIGREEHGKEIFASDFMISRRHCFVKATRFGDLQITDCGSLNGTFIDDNGRKRLGNNETVSLKVGSKLYLADFVFTVENN